MASSIKYGYRCDLLSGKYICQTRDMFVSFVLNQKYGSFHRISGSASKALGPSVRFKYQEDVDIVLMLGTYFTYLYVPTSYINKEKYVYTVL